MFGNKIDHSSKYKYLYTLPDVLNTIDFLVNNTYITLTGKLFKQFGIPMGTNSGVNIVDFYLMSYELNFIRQLVNLQKWDLVEAFGRTIRYLDDILSIDNLNFNELLYTDINKNHVNWI